MAGLPETELPLEWIMVLFGIIFCIVFGVCTGIVRASESPQRDLYKIDVRDWYFVHQHDYAINQVEYTQIAKGSEFWGLWFDLQKQIKKHERTVK
jgi:hypothetical protein